MRSLVFFISSMISSWAGTLELCLRNSRVSATPYSDFRMSPILSMSLSELNFVFSMSATRLPSSERGRGAYAIACCVAASVVGSRISMIFSSRCTASAADCTPWVPLAGARPAGRLDTLPVDLSGDQIGREAGHDPTERKSEPDMVEVDRSRRDVQLVLHRLAAREPLPDGHERPARRHLDAGLVQAAAIRVAGDAPAGIPDVARRILHRRPIREEDVAGHVANTRAVGIPDLVAVVVDDARAVRVVLLAEAVHHALAVGIIVDARIGGDRLPV